MVHILKFIFLALFTGVLSGLLSSFFLYTLKFVTNYRGNHPFLIYFLPIFGLAFAFIIKKIPHHINQGVPYLLSEVENERAKVSVWMTPFIFISSIGTHLFGGSAGREGVGVIMGASISHLLPQIYSLFASKKNRAFLIYTGMAAGFSSIFGTPLAAIFFAFELHHFKEFKKIDLIVYTSISSFSAFLISHFIGPIHGSFNVSFDYDWNILFYVMVAAMTSGIGANIFYFGMKYYTKAISYFFKQIETKLFFGSVIIVALVITTNGHDYIGIGSTFIEQSFFRERSLYDFFMKCLLTISTLSIGYKGGEVTPLFFMGATFANALSVKVGLTNFALSSALGMVGLFGAVTATPLASAFIAYELFGYKVGVLALATSFIAKKLMGTRSVYRH